MPTTKELAGFFYLRDKSGQLTPLEIQSVVTTSGDYSRYTLKGFSELIIGEVYHVLEEHAMACPLQYGWIVRTERFNKEFYSDRNDFGAQVKGDQTFFTVWAPTALNVKVHLFWDNKEHILNMERKDKGVFTCVVSGNMHGALYQYLVDVNGQLEASLDPYGFWRAILSTFKSSRQASLILSHRVKLSWHSHIVTLCVGSLNSFTTSLSSVLPTKAALADSIILTSPVR